MKRRVVVLGEVLCDVFSRRRGVPLATTDALVPRLGGAPANVAVQLARLGVDVALISAVGRDPLGVRAIAELRKEGVDPAAIKIDPSRRTGLTLVEVDRRGERRFFPFRENSADLGLATADLDASLIRRAAVVHTGTVSLRSTSARTATRRAVQIAKSAGVIVSLDVNLRWGMYPSREMLLQLATRACRRADVIKSTREEAIALVGPARNDILVDRLFAFGARLVFLTLDADGAVMASRTSRVHVRSPRVRVVDATGAGDAFIGTAIARMMTHGVTRDGLAGLDRDMLEDIGHQACAAGASTVRVQGATAGMPRKFS